MGKAHVDKKYTIIDDDTISTTQEITTLYLATQRVTFLGGHIDLTLANDNSATNSGIAVIAIIKVAEGFSANTLGVTSGGDLYEPGEDVLWASVIYFDEAIDSAFRVREKLNAKRKLSEGDGVYIVRKAEQAGMSASIGGLFTGFILE